MSEIKPWLEPSELTIGGQNTHRVTEDELEDVATAEYGPDGKPRPVTVREVLYGDGSVRHPMGIMPSTSRNPYLSDSCEVLTWMMSPRASKMIKGKMRRIKLAEKRRKRAKQQRQARKKARGR